MKDRTRRLPGGREFQDRVRQWSADHGYRVLGGNDYSCTRRLVKPTHKCSHNFEPDFQGLSHSITWDHVVWLDDAVGQPRTRYLVLAHPYGTPSEQDYGVMLVRAARDVWGSDASEVMAGVDIQISEPELSLYGHGTSSVLIFGATKDHLVETHNA